MTYKYICIYVYSHVKLVKYIIYINTIHKDRTTYMHFVYIGPSLLECATSQMLKTKIALRINMRTFRRKPKKSMDSAISGDLPVP